jgi:hypothetical protein
MEVLWLVVLAELLLLLGWCGIYILNKKFFLRNEVFPTSQINISISKQ